MSIKSKLSLVAGPEKPAAHMSQLALTFEAEIKRIAGEAGVQIADVMRELSNVSGVSENHLYNYRSGRTDIPGSTIKVFCSIFRSNALASVLMIDEIEFEDDDAYDLARMCNRHVRSMLESGEEFLDAFEDGHIDGHEEIKLARTTARIRRDSFRLLEVAQSFRRRRQSTAPGPVAA